MSPPDGRNGGEAGDVTARSGSVTPPRSVAGDVPPRQVPLFGAGRNGGEAGDVTPRSGSVTPPRSVAGDVSPRQVPLLKAIAVAHEQLELRIAANLEEQRMSILQSMSSLTQAGYPQEADARPQESTAADRRGLFCPPGRTPDGAAFLDPRVEAFRGGGPPRLDPPGAEPPPGSGGEAVLPEAELRAAQEELQAAQAELRAAQAQLRAAQQPWRQLGPGPSEALRRAEVAENGTRERDEDFEFRVVVDRTAGQKLGMTWKPVRSHDRGWLAITAETSGGLLQQWNENHPTLAVKPGDRIVEVNGIRNDSKELRNEVNEHKILELRVKRDKVRTLASADDHDALVTSATNLTSPKLTSLSSTQSKTSSYGEGSRAWTPRFLTRKEPKQSGAMAHSLSVELRHMSQGRQVVLENAHSQASRGSCVGMLNYIMARPEMEVLVASVILMNAASIGAQADWRIKNLPETPPKEYRFLDIVFISVFTVEVLIRIIASGRTFLQWSNKQFSWNVFDSVLVLVSLLGEANPFNLNLSVVRVFRVFRLAHVVRMIRLLKGFRELRLMVTGIMNCGRTLLWSCIILLALTYIYAVFLLQIIAEWQIEEERTSANAQSLKDNFRSLEFSIYLLIQAVLGGVSWGELSTPMEEVSTLLRLSFPMYIIVIVLCVLNIITASFVEAAQRTSQDEDTKFIEHIEDRELWIQKLLQVFAMHDTQGDQTLDWEEFQDAMGPNNWRTQTLCREIGLDLDYQDLRTLFALFDVDGNQRIDVNEFAQSIFHYRGNARSVDMVRLFRQLEHNVEQKVDRAVEKILDPRSPVGSSTVAASPRERAVRLDAPPRRRSTTSSGAAPLVPTPSLGATPREHAPQERRPSLGATPREHAPREHRLATPREH